MITWPSLRPLRGALIAFFPVVFASHTALAELPHHLHVQTLDPDPALVMDPTTGGLADLRYGHAVAIRNGMAFISMTQADPERVDVWSQTANGWERTQTIEAPDSAAAADFGRTLAFRDGALIVGADKAAYVYRRSSGAWKLKQTLAPPSADNIASFAVAMWYEAGELVISGVESQTARGSVYVFEPDASGKFVERTRLQPRDGFDRDFFGESVATTRGRTIVVGAPGESNLGRDAAYVFRRNAAHEWVQTQKLVPAGKDSWENFGTAVAMDNEMILIGAPSADAEGRDIGPPTDDEHVAQGVVYGYVPVGGQYVETLRLRPSPDELFAYEHFGQRLAMFGKRIAVSAHDEMISGLHAPPALIISYSRIGNDVIPLGLAKLGAETQSTSLSIANNLLLAGSPFKTCTSDGCLGQANILDLLRFAQTSIAPAP